MEGTNTLAYTVEKSFTVHAIGVNVIDFFVLLGATKLECLSLKNLFNLI